MFSLLLKELILYFYLGPSKQVVKGKIKAAVGRYVSDQWVDDAANKSSLKYPNIQSCTVGKVHNCWTSVCNNARDMRRANVKVKLLTSTYILQENRFKFNQYQVCPWCLLCDEAPEDLAHFLLDCSLLQSVDPIMRPGLCTFWMVLPLPVCWAVLFYMKQTGYPYQRNQLDFGKSTFIGEINL